MTDKIEVTRADREAAAAYYYSAGGSYNIAKEIREGRKDNWFRVQAFARHRLASTADAQPVAWMYERKGQETLVFAYRWQDPVERPGWREIPLAALTTYQEQCDAE